jgi:hypothetical protein
MSWLTKRVQAGRRRGKNRSKQARRRRLLACKTGAGMARFLSGAIDEQKERAAPGQCKDNQ